MDDLFKTQKNEQKGKQKNYTKKDGVFYFNLSDGRQWCPSRQNRGTVYNYQEESLKDYKNIIYKTLDFVAIDFETATKKEQMPCQIGIIVVRNGKVDERIERYIQPPNNIYSKQCTKIHGITPSKTEHELSFSEVWEEIKQYFDGEFIVMHNASFDITVLEKALDYYELEYPSIIGYSCTCELFNKMSLDKACKMFDIKLDNHHNGLCDAEACAYLYLSFVNNTPPKYSIDEIDKINETNIVEKEDIEQLSFFSEQYKGHERLKGDILQKDLSGADPKNPFYDRKVVITGVFSQSRQELGLVLKSMGADINTGITKKTTYVLIGEDAGEKKLEKLEKLIHDGFNIRKLYQKDIDSILLGDWEGYYADKEIKKDLDFTIEHYNKHHILFENDKNIIASKELFYGKGIAGNFDLFNQITGNLGAAGDNEIYPETNICILSDSTISKLKKGEKDETILYIQDFYNNNKSITFDLKFILEAEILRFCKERCMKCGDKITMELYEKYMDTITPVPT